MAENKDDWCGRREPGHRIYCDPDVFKPLPNVLLRNNRDGTFTDVSEQVGLNRYLGKGMGVAVADFDGDGRMDVFVTNDRMPHFLYRNGADGKFSEVAFEAGVAANETGAMVSGMGCDFKDFDNDGRPDIFADRPGAGHLHALRQPGQGLLPRPDLPVRRSGRPRSRTAAGAPSSSTSTTTAARTSSSAGSHVVDNVALYSPGRSTRRAASCTATWARAGSRTCPSAWARTSRSPGAWRGVAVADLDNDGTLEVAVSRLNGPAALFVKKGGARQQLDPAGPPGHPEQPGRHRRPRPAGAALGPHALRARDDRERDLLRERQARALRARERRRASPTSRSRGPAGSCSASRSPRSTRVLHVVEAAPR